MGMRAYKIQKVNSLSTFELRYDALLTDMLEDLGKFEGLNEDGGIMEIKEEDLEEMKEMMKEKAGDYDGRIPIVWMDRNCCIISFPVLS